MSTLQALHDLLLDQSKWPDDFCWDYGQTDRCAIGLAYEAGLIKTEPMYVSAHDFDMSHGVFHHLFFGYYSTEPGRVHVQPHQIAERITEYLDS